MFLPCFTFICKLHFFDYVPTRRIHTQIHARSHTHIYTHQICVCIGTKFTFVWTQPIKIIGPFSFLPFLVFWVQWSFFLPKGPLTEWILWKDWFLAMSVQLWFWHLLLNSSLKMKVHFSESTPFFSGNLRYEIMKARKNWKMPKRVSCFAIHYIVFPLKFASLYYFLLFLYYKI